MGRLTYGFKVMFCVFVFSLFWIGLSSFSSFFFFYFLFYFVEMETVLGN